MRLLIESNQRMISMERFISRQEYDTLMAEHILWVANRSRQPFETLIAFTAAMVLILEAPARHATCHAMRGSYREVWQLLPCH